MATEIENARPNIRVQIHNNLTESMEVDYKSDNEEGEISEDDKTESDKQLIQIQNTDESSNSNRIFMNTPSVFSTGINIFDHQEQGKLQERAKRFALRPEEITNFTKEDLEELHVSLGITSDVLPTVRFGAIHLTGVKEMTAEDLLEYFQKYAPIGVEWITDETCNIFWQDTISPARALHFVSRAVKDMPVRRPYDVFPKDFIDDVDADLINSVPGQSVLLRNENREVELQEDEPTLPKVSLKNAADLSEISIPIPPGYWRLGVPHPKSKCILMRFALKADQQPIEIVNFSKSKKHGISDSKKKELRGIFERNRELNDDKNPWGSLAKNWNKDKKFCEREPEIEVPQIAVKNRSLFVRLGSKRKFSEPEDNVEEEVVEEKVEKKKVKLPRMRMYADEEEEIMKRKKILQTIKKQADKIAEDDLGSNDLRNILYTNTNQKTVPIEVAREEAAMADLGSKLKNRSKKMTFAVEREAEESENVPRKDIRHFLDERRATSQREKSPERRRHRRSPVRTTSRYRRRSTERTMHSDRMHSDRMHKSVLEDAYSDEEYANKPKSKVAIVIKTQKKPSVASAVWSKVQKQSETESSTNESESEEELNSSSSSVGSKSENDVNVKIERPGFSSKMQGRLSEKKDHRSPLKIEINNDHFKK